MTHWVGAQDQANLVQKAKACPRYDVTHKKAQTQNQKQIFQKSKLEDIPNP